VAASSHAVLDTGVSLSDNTELIAALQKSEEGGEGETESEDRGDCEISILLLRKASAFNLAVAISEVRVGGLEMAEVLEYGDIFSYVFNLMGLGVGTP